MISQITAPTARLPAVTPELWNGDTELSPMPEPRVRSRTVAAVATAAPAKIAGQATADC